MCGNCWGSMLGALVDVKIPVVDVSDTEVNATSEVRALSRLGLSIA